MPLPTAPPNPPSLHCAGKSTLAALFAQAGWAVVNQDTLGDRKQCEAACLAALARGTSCVVDRVNHTAMQRQHWVSIARRCGATAVALSLELPAELCLQRALVRSGHATLGAAEAPAVIERFKAEWQYPRRREGFDRVVAAQTSEQAAALAQQLMAQLPAAVAVAPVAPPGIEPAVPPGGRDWLSQPPLQPAPQQQHRQYSSRAGAAGSWRRSEEGGPPPPPPRQQQPLGAHWGEPRQQAAPPGAGFASAARHAGGGEGASNVVPFPGRHGRQQHPHHPPRHAESDPHKPRRHPWSQHGPDEPSGLVLDGEPSAKPILMFDANGVLTSHTAMRRSSGLHKARPGTPHLRRLKVGPWLCVLAWLQVTRGLAAPATAQLAMPPGWDHPQRIDAAV